MHHAQPIAGENRELLDAKLGIYNFQDLYVLRTAQSPALLFEAGITSNPQDEQRLHNAAHRSALVDSLLGVAAMACRDARPQPSESGRSPKP